MEATMGRKYKTSPIIEALCEFRFDPSSRWDMTIPGLIYAEVKGTFERTRTAKVLETALIPQEKGIQQQFIASERSQLLRADEKALMQVGEHILVVNRLKPYDSWAEFLPLIQQGFGAYCGVAKPRGVARIGLRYINRVEIPSETLRLDDYFLFHPATPPALSQSLAAFICGVQVAYSEPQSMLKVELTNTTDAESSSAFMLDLDHFTLSPCDPAFDDVFAWIERAHSRVEAAFEACITDQLRNIFGEEK